MADKENADWASPKSRKDTAEPVSDREIWALHCLYYGIDPALPEVAPVPPASMH